MDIVRPTFCAMALVLSLLAIVSSHAREYKIDGFDVDIFWEQINDEELKVSGFIEDMGRKCRTLEVNVNMSNKRSNSTKYYQFTIKDYGYRGASLKKFRDTKKVYTNRAKKYWSPKDVWVKCYD